MVENAGSSNTQAKTKKLSPKIPLPNSGKKSTSVNVEKIDVAVIGDSTIKYVRGHRLSKQHKVRCFTFSSASTADMQDFVKPVIRKKPTKAILHVGTNDAAGRAKPNQISKKIVDLAKNVNSQGSSIKIAISSIIHRSDDLSLNAKICQINENLKKSCLDNDLEFICNDNIKNDCLNTGGLHPNVKGTIKLAANFRKFVNAD